MLWSFKIDTQVARVWHPDVASWLIDHGADPDQGDNFGRTALHVAAATDYPSMVELLLQKNGRFIGTTRKSSSLYSSLVQKIGFLQQLCRRKRNVPAYHVHSAESDLSFKIFPKFIHLLESFKWQLCMLILSFLGSKNLD